MNPNYDEKREKASPEKKSKEEQEEYYEDEDGYYDMEEEERRWAIENKKKIDQLIQQEEIVAAAIDAYHDRDFPLQITPWPFNKPWKTQDWIKWYVTNYEKLKLGSFTNRDWPYQYRMEIVSN